MYRTHYSKKYSTCSCEDSCFHWGTTLPLTMCFNQHSGFLSVLRDMEFGEREFTFMEYLQHSKLCHKCFNLSHYIIWYRMLWGKCYYYLCFQIKKNSKIWTLNSGYSFALWRGSKYREVKILWFHGKVTEEMAWLGPSSSSSLRGGSQGVV